MIYVLGFIFLSLVLYFFIFLFNYYKLKDINICIETCADNINNTLNTKLELVQKLLTKINSNKIEKKFEYDNESNIYEREDALFNVSFEINKYIKETKNKKFKDDLNKLNILEENLDGLKDFYNTNVLNYNEIYFNRFFNKIFKLFKFDNYKSFKIRKLEEYEIFKN